MCAAYIEGCAFGAPLGVCRDVCAQARSACSSSLFAMPDDAKRRLECEQYVDGERLACSNPSPNPNLPLPRGRRQERAKVKTS